MSHCTQWSENKRQECSRTADEGYKSCAQTRDEGYSKCCDWWPCSWFCDAWVWISNVVCVAWTWVSNIVCVAWTWVTEIVCVAWDTIVTVIGAITAAIATLVGVLTSWLGAILSFIEAIPILGRIISWIVSVVQAVVWGLLSVVDVVGTFLGIMPEKKLRLCVIIQLDEAGAPITTPDIVLPFIQRTIQIFADQANVRVLPVSLLEYASAYQDQPKASADYIAVESSPSTSTTLDVCCDACAAGHDLLTTGSAFDLKMTTDNFWGGARRLLGYGSPICAFAVRGYSDNKRGCSLGPLADYVTVQFVSSETTHSTLAHEIGHACNLWHVGDTVDLMFPDPTRGDKLERWQVALVRASRHVTYF